MPKPTSRGSDEANVEFALRKFLKKREISYDYKTDSWLQQTPGGIEALTWATLDDLIIVYGGALSKALRKARSALNLHALNAQKLTLARIRSELDSWPRDDGETASAWIQAVCKEGEKLSLILLQHWIWCVRRRLLGLSVRDHVCPVLYGRTGSGKSTELMKLLAPLDQFVSAQDLTQVCDERHWGELARHYVVYIDEMAGADRGQLDTLKSLITQEHTTSHVFFTQRRQLCKQNAMLIGSSNRPVIDLIRDTTSARRYWEIRAKDVLDWDKLAKLDRRAIWASVDPHQDSPLKGQNLKDIQQLQHNKLRLKPPQELWWEEMCLDYGDVPVPMAKLWESFRQFAIDNGYMPSNSERLSRWLGAQGCGRTKSHGIRCRLLSTDSAKKFLS